MASVSSVQQDVMSALGQVLDVCSVVNGHRLSLLELGMVESVRIDPDEVHVELVLDDPTCPYFFEMARDMKDRISGVVGVSDVSVAVNGREMWMPDRRGALPVVFASTPSAGSEPEGRDVPPPP